VKFAFRKFNKLNLNSRPPYPGPHSGIHLSPAASSLPGDESLLSGGGDDSVFLPNASLTMSPPTGKAPMLPSGDIAELTAGSGGGGFFSRLKVRVG